MIFLIFSIDILFFLTSSIDFDRGKGGFDIQKVYVFFTNV